jgi:signal transduction histidine kinase
MTSGPGSPTRGGQGRQVRDLDVLLAALAFAALLIDPVVAGRASDVTPVAAGLALLAAAPLVDRRRSPLGVLAVDLPLLVACLLVFHPSRAAVGIVMLLVFTVGVQGDRTRSLAVGVVMALVVTAAVLVTARNLTVSDVVAYPALVLGTLAAGEAVRARHALQQAMYEEAERERRASAQRRFDAERLRMAHELHDVIGHALVAINVRAAAASHLERHRNNAAVTTVLDEIAMTSADALAELRSTLGLLRPDPTTPAPLHPAQSLDDLPELVAGVESAGLAVTLEMTVVPSTLSSSVAHAAYRIVQESLTNVLRHSTATSARVRVASDDDAVVVEVANDGRQKPSPPAGHGGHGLPGMKERAAALGGVCHAGPLPEGGWEVRARIPVAAGSS